MCLVLLKVGQNRSIPAWHFRSWTKLKITIFRLSKKNLTRWLKWKTILCHFLISMVLRDMEKGRYLQKYEKSQIYCTLLCMYVVSRVYKCLHGLSWRPIFFPPAAIPFLRSWLSHQFQTDHKWNDWRILSLSKIFMKKAKRGNDTKKNEDKNDSRGKMIKRRQTMIKYKNLYDINFFNKW